LTLAGVGFGNNQIYKKQKMKKLIVGLAIVFSIPMAAQQSAEQKLV
jgi:hypothetical protein